MKTQSHMMTIVCALVACGLLCVGGCIKPDPEVLARIDALEAQLEKLEETAVAAQADRRALAQQLEGIVAKLTAAETQIAELIQAGQAAADVKLAEIAAQRDAAMAQANETLVQMQLLQDQLIQQAGQINDFKLQLTDLQTAMTPPEPEPVEEPVAAAEPEPEPEPAKPDGPVIGFPEGDDPSVTVIRGRTGN